MAAVSAVISEREKIFGSDEIVGVDRREKRFQIPGRAFPAVGRGSNSTATIPPLGNCRKSGRKNSPFSKAVSTPDEGNRGRFNDTSPSVASTDPNKAFNSDGTGSGWSKSRVSPHSTHRSCRGSIHDQQCWHSVTSMRKHSTRRQDTRRKDRNAPTVVRRPSRPQPHRSIFPGLSRLIDPRTRHVPQSKRHDLHKVQGRTTLLFKMVALLRYCFVRDIPSMSHHVDTVDHYHHES